MQLSPVQHPIIMSPPLRVRPSGWLKHIPFAMLLIDLLRPSQLVELGVYHGVSYCAFCQAVQGLNTGTRCFGIDTFNGDIHSGAYGADVLDDLREHHDPLYGDFSQLMQLTFDEALEHFEDGSVDLLHIDGCHQYDAIRHDFESWLPKLSARGVVLFHDTNVHDGDFGVWRYWQQLKRDYKHFEFYHGYGLGVLAVGPQYPQGLDQLLDLAGDDATRLRQFFEQVGAQAVVREDLRAGQQECMSLRQRSLALAADLTAATAQAQALSAQSEQQVKTLLSAHGQQIALLNAQIDDLHSRRQADHAEHQNTLNAVRRDYQDSIDRLRAELAAVHTAPPAGDLDAVHRHVEQLQAELLAMTTTRSWKLVQTWYGVKGRVFPPASRRLRAYELSRTSLGMLVRQGPNPLVRQAYRWLIKGERRYHGKVGEAPPPPPPAEDAGMGSGQLTEPTAADGRGSGLTEQQARLKAQFKAVLEAAQSRTTADLSLLDWNTGLDLASLLAGLSVFSPPDPAASAALPYLSDTVDLVVVASSEPSLLNEANRVAQHAVIVVTPQNGMRAADLQVEWKQDIDRAAAWPSVSIIIPAFNQTDYTSACLEQLEETMPPALDVEIIVVDDASSDPAVEESYRHWLGRLPNLRVIRNATNAGFTRTCNVGAAAARGEILIFLNNDTLPLDGWLLSLIRTLREHPEAGAAGGKLIYADGRLQEAGCLVFSDGSAWNFGNGLAPDDPIFGFVREVDYCSAAVLATWKRVFEEVGGFDDRYSPAYYEDVDYCFGLRARGYRIYYQPDCQVIHFEGVSHGRDPLDVHSRKNYQPIHQATFVQKWADALRWQPSKPTAVTHTTMYRHLVTDRTGSRGAAC